MEASTVKKRIEQFNKVNEMVHHLETHLGALKLKKERNKNTHTNLEFELKEIQNKRNVLFCGSYFGYGFHEDGIKSSIEMLKNLND